MTAMDVCDAIAETLAAAWPERIIYRDFCPADFQRPSLFLYVTEPSMTQAAIGLVEWTVEVTLELFCATDEYDISSTEELRRDQELVLLAFAAPSLQVGDRHVSLSAKGDGMELGSAYVTFTASWYDQRPGYHDPDDMTDPDSAAIPVMEELHTTFSSPEISGETD